MTRLVSVRMPLSLVTALREIAQKKHFMDLSEEIRFIVKEKMREETDPLKYEILKFKDEIKKEISARSKMDRVLFVDEMTKLLEEIKKQ